MLAGVGALLTQSIIGFTLVSSLLKEHVLGGLDLNLLMLQRCEYTSASSREGLLFILEDGRGLRLGFGGYRLGCGVRLALALRRAVVGAVLLFPGRGSSGVVCLAFGGSHCVWSRSSGGRPKISEQLDACLGKKKSGERYGRGGFSGCRCGEPKVAGLA